MKDSTSAGKPIKVGVIADETGALSFAGIANANVARMVIDDINAKGGLLGRQIDLNLEDGATSDTVAEAKAANLVQQDQHEELDQKGSAGDKRVYTDRRAETRTVTPVWSPERPSAARGGWRVHFF